MLIAATLASSCNLRKNVTYFQQDSSDSISINASYTPILTVDDLLSIIVMANKPETAIPFNLPTDLNKSTNSGYSQGNPERSGYLIDEKGNVNLPIIGKVHLAGLNRTEAQSMLEKKYQNYLDNPVVHIQILNFKVTVLGDVQNPGTFKIPNERITVLEAIGLSGDVAITGKRKNVLIVRDSCGVKTQYRMDLTNTRSVFESPAYYLQQNDVVYVEPNVAQRTNGAFWKSSAPIFISTAGVIISTITVISVLSK